MGKSPDLGQPGDDHSSVATNLQAVWDKVCDLFYGFRVAWISTASVLIGLVLFVFSLQVQDLFLESNGDWHADVPHWLKFNLIVVLFWVLPVFVSARWILTYFRSGPHAHKNVSPVAGWVSKRVPQILAASCVLAIAVSQYMAWERAPTIENVVYSSAQTETGGADASEAVQPDTAQAPIQVESFSLPSFYLALVILFGWFYVRKYLRKDYYSDSMGLASAAISSIVLIGICFAFFFCLIPFLNWVFGHLLPFVFDSSPLAGTGVAFFLAKFVQLYGHHLLSPVTLMVLAGVAIALVPILAVLLWAGKQNLVRGIARCCWWLATLLIILPIALFFLYWIVAFVVSASQTPLGRAQLFFLPNISLILTLLVWFAAGRLLIVEEGSSEVFPAGISEGEEHSSRLLLNRKHTSTLFFITFGVSVLVFILFIALHPLITSQYVYRALLLPVILGIPVAFFTYISHWSLRCRAPFVLLVVIFILLPNFLISRGDPYDVRVLLGENERADLEETVKRWASVNECDLTSSDNCPAPVIVSAAGGASRAAYFMTGVLGSLIDKRRSNDQVLAGHTDAVNAAVISPDGTRIVTVSSDGNGILWNAATSTPIRFLEGHKHPIMLVKYSPDGRRIATATRHNYENSKDLTLRLWDGETGELVKILDGHESTVWDFNFSADSRRLLTEGGNLWLWDGVSGDFVNKIPSEAIYGRYATFSPSGKYIVETSQDKINLYDANSGQQLEMPISDPEGAAKAWLSPDDQRLLAEYNSGSAALFDRTSGDLIAEFDIPDVDSVSAKFSPDGSRIVTSARMDAALWDGVTGKHIKDLKGHKTLVGDIAFSPDSKRLVTTANFDVAGYVSDLTARLWDAETGELIKVLEGHERDVLQALFSPDGLRVLTVSEYQTARLWNGVTGEFIAVLSGHKGIIKTAQFSLDGKTIVTASEDGTARRWDGITGLPAENLSRLRPFEKQLFAISAVSGGAVGALATYAALVDSQLHHTDKQADLAPPCLAGAEDVNWYRHNPKLVRTLPKVEESWRDCLQLLSVGDFLSPVFISLAGTDQLTIGVRGNRAEILEQALEAHYGRLTGETTDFTVLRKKEGSGSVERQSTLARSLLSLRKSVLDADPDNWLPVLLLNGTSVSSGKRIVTSDVDSLTRDEEGRVRARIFHDAYDLHELLNGPRAGSGKKCDSEKGAECKRYDIRLSTAAMMSARFPIVSPPGHIRFQGGYVTDRVVDGGYFENFGATTTIELANLLEQKWGLKPLVVLINNDPFGFGMECIDRESFQTYRRVGQPWFSSLLAPIDAILRTRTARGTHAAVNLCNRLDKKRFAFISVEPSHNDLPLSWWLSKRVQKKLDEAIDAPVNGRGFLTINEARRRLKQVPKSH